MAEWVPEFSASDAFFVLDGARRVIRWSTDAEELTGIAAEETLGRPCWQVLGSLGMDGAMICHSRCSVVGLRGKDQTPRTQSVSVRTAHGRRRVSLSTVTVRDRERVYHLHLMRETSNSSAGEMRRLPPTTEVGPPLTARQREVLELMADGNRARKISRLLNISEVTVRNHIRAILAALDCHSQVEALAKARKLGFI